MKRATIDLWVGIFVVLGLVALLFLALQVGNLASVGREAKTYRIEAHFDNIGGLKPRAPVKAAGVVVGRVEQIRFDPKLYEAVAVMNINEKYSFTTDTLASVLTSGLLGEVYIGLDVGGSEEMLVNGSVLPRTQTQSAVVLEKLIGQFFLRESTASSGGK
ncbi:MAG: outer membrane lipid asymmetry maintenance protein MlaD [Burkholderiales bacterium]|jgi:phospholipid/cholesterol/gamma-HCH transport system substrate-binding protein|nr:outer membrane lipid asymmetry maintenance protein MlaD [Burkholderiales bacterium]